MRLTREEQRLQRAWLKTLPKQLTKLPDSEIQSLSNAATLKEIGLFAVWRSRYFLVQAFNESDGIVRLSINRTTWSGERWEDGISWEQIQLIKREVGYGDYDAVEIYPRSRDVVNVANMRHIWVMPEPLPYAWRR